MARGHDRCSHVGAVDLSLSSHVLAGHTVVEVAGEADVFTAQQLRDYIMGLVDGGARKIVLDLDRLEFLGSAALGVMVGIHRRLRLAGGSIAVVCGQPGPLRVITMSGVDRTLRLYESVRAAIETHTETPSRPAPRAESEAFQAKLEAIWRESISAARKAAATRPAQRRPDLPERTPGPRVDLSAAERGQIVELYVKGKGIIEVAELFAVPDEFVWRLLRAQGLGPAEWP
jgi:anti-sigma B factor antagonist